MYAPGIAKGSSVADGRDETQSSEIAAHCNIQQHMHTEHLREHDQERERERERERENGIPQRLSMCARTAEQKGKHRDVCT